MQVRPENSSYKGLFTTLTAEVQATAPAEPVVVLQYWSALRSEVSSYLVWTPSSLLSDCDHFVR